MKSCALADVVTKLMLKNRTYEWETEIQNLPCQLESISIEELLQVNSFHLSKFSANVTECDVYPRIMPRRIEIVGQCSQQDCLSRHQVLLCSLLNEELIGVNLALCLKAYQVEKDLTILCFIFAARILYVWYIREARRGSSRDKARTARGSLQTHFQTKALS